MKNNIRLKKEYKDTVLLVELFNYFINHEYFASKDKTINDFIAYASEKNLFQAKKLDDLPIPTLEMFSFTETNKEEQRKFFSIFASFVSRVYSRLYPERHRLVSIACIFKNSFPRRRTFSRRTFYKLFQKPIY